MKAAFVLALIFSAVALSLQPALATTSPTVDVQLLVGLTQLDTHEVVLVEANNIVIHLPSGDKAIQSALVDVNGDFTKCATVVVTGCPTPTQAVLSDCGDAKTYTITPGGIGVGTFSDGDSVDGTVFNGDISLTCQSIPPVPTIRR